MRVFLEAALNGTRSNTDHPGIPVTPAHLATEAVASVASGATAIHVHVRDQSGGESLDPEHVSQTLQAIRRVCAGVPVGISTGAWIVPDLYRRLTLIREWTVLPDFASVNLHEAGATKVIKVLLEKGIGVEAGIWNAPAATLLLESGLIGQCDRILLEPAEAACWARHNLKQIEAALSNVDRPRLLHGLGRSTWDFVALATERGYDARVGFEDTLRLPDGTLAGSNAELVTAARRIVENTRRINSQ